MNAPAPSPTNDAPVQPGTMLAGKYRVERVIGRGGMGIVVEARHLALDKRVALKFLTPEYALQPEAAARFEREARAAAKIQSEHVARVSDVGVLESGSPYMVMEFLEGTDLSKALEDYGVCQIPDAVDYILQTCEAIAEAHAHGIIHRDLKPANLFLTRRPDGTPMVKVLDFGISKMAGGGVENLTKTMSAMGSALYMSPEQMQQTRGVDHRTDIYALGISLYELLAGKQPFYADTLPQLCAEVLTGIPTPIQQLRAEVSGGLAAVLEKAYARDKQHRYQSIAELAIGLAPYAPPRSQSSIDRVARMAGLSAPMAGGPVRYLGSHSSPNLGISGPSPAMGYASQAVQTGNYGAVQPGAPVQTGNYPTGPHPAQTGNYPTGPHAAQNGNYAAEVQVSLTPSEMPISGYQGPMSTKAAAAFAGVSTSSNLSSTGAVQGGTSSKGALIVLALFGTLLLLAGGAFFALRGGGDPTPAVDPPAPIPSATVSTTAAASATATTTAPSAEPGTSPTATGTEVAPGATASPTATATSTATGTVKPKTPATKPTASVKKPGGGVMTSR